MPLINQLSQALQNAIDQIEEHNSEYQHKTPPEKLTEWRDLIAKVRVLDSNLYDSLKCEIARCVPGTAHYCGQGVRYEVITSSACDQIYRDGAGGAVSRQQAFDIIYRAIAEALGTLTLSQDVKIIRDRLTVLRSYINHRETLELAISRYTIEDLNWLHDVAIRSLGLFAKESFQSWCGPHRKQRTACPECLKAARTYTLKVLARAVKKVCPPEVVQALIAAAHPEEEFTAFLRETSKDPVEGVGL